MHFSRRGLSKVPCFAHAVKEPLAPSAIPTLLYLAQYKTLKRDLDVKQVLYDVLYNGNLAIFYESTYFRRGLLQGTLLTKFGK